MFDEIKDALDDVQVVVENADNLSQAQATTVLIVANILKSMESVTKATVQVSVIYPNPVNWTETIQSEVPVLYGASLDEAEEGNQKLVKLYEELTAGELVPEECVPRDDVYYFWQPISGADSNDGSSVIFSIWNPEKQGELMCEVFSGAASTIWECFVPSSQEERVLN